ncbi:hypothetical protein QBC45DRAFT_135786 [Copromyces sp. CBS 386.78]|nr:hypothetical protein QBC45DRAFT_135786 [Copromyces sp. CBS 386.78]
MVRTRRMAALTSDENNGQDNSDANVNEPQSMEIVDEKPPAARTRKTPAKPKGRKTTKKAAAQTSVKEEEQAEGTGHVEQQEAETLNTSIAPDHEEKNVGTTSDQSRATANRTKPSAKRAQPKATKAKPTQPKSKSKTTTVIETPEWYGDEEELDLDTPYMPKDLRKELCEHLSMAGHLHPETWRFDSPFDAPPPPPENPPPPDSVLVVGLADREVFRLRQLLRHWVSEEKGSSSRVATKFFHRLDYTYNKADSLPEALARHDRALALTLERLSREIPFEVFLCRLDRGFEDIDTDPQQASPSYVTEDLIDTQGRTYAKFVPVDENDWTKKTTEHWKPKLLPGYCDAALVLVPRDTVADFLWETIEANGPPTAKYNVTQTPLRTLLENYKTRCAEDHDRYWPIFSNILRRACTWDSEKGLGFMPGEFVEGLLKACISAKDWDLFTFAAGFTGFTFRKMPYDPRPFVKWARTEVTEGRAAFQDIQQGILAVSFSHSLVNHRCSSITAFYETTDEAVPRDWAQNAVSRIADFSDSQIIGQQDGSELVSAMKTCFGLGLEFRELATKVVKRNSTKFAFLLGFANELYESVTSKDDVTQELYLSLAEHIVNELHIHELHSRSAETARVREIIQIRSTHSKVEQSLQLLQPAIEGVDKADISRFISGLIAEEADTLLMRLTMKLVGDVRRIPLRELTHLWVPFLSLLLDVLEKHQIPLSTPRYQNIFAAIMEVYLLKEVGKAPKQVWQPAMRSITCGCGLCFRVNQFLSESSFNAIRIHGSSAAFGHVQNYLIGLREGISCDFTIDAASGTITVTKRLKSDATAIKQWEAKKDNVRKQIFAKFDQAKLRAILGEEYSWFTGFELLENVLDAEVHDEEELPPPPVAVHQNPHQPFHPSPVSGYQGPQPGQAPLQPVGTFYNFRLPPPNEGYRPPANPWAAIPGHTSQPVQYGQHFQSGPPQSTQSVVSVSVGSNGFAGCVQMINNVNNQQTTTHIDGFSGSINVIQNNVNNHQTTEIRGRLEQGRQLFFKEEATVIQTMFPSWQSDAIDAELRRRWTMMLISLVEGYVNRATAAQNQAQTQPGPSLPAPFHSAHQPSGPSSSTENDLKAGWEYYFSTQMGFLRAKHPTYSYQLLVNTVRQQWSSMPREHREWFNKQALTQKQQQPQLPPLNNRRAVGLSRAQSIPSLSSIVPPPPLGAVEGMLKGQSQHFPSLEARVAALREEAKVTPTTALAIKKPVVDRHGMVFVRESTQVSIPEKDYMESKARLAPYPDVAHLDPCRKQLDRGRAWWVDKYNHSLCRVLPGKSAQEITQKLGAEWETCLGVVDRLMTDDLARIEDAKSGRASAYNTLNAIMSRKPNKRARTSKWGSTRMMALSGPGAMDDPPLSSSDDEDPAFLQRGEVTSTSMTGRRPSASTAVFAAAPASVASPPVSGYEAFVKEIEPRLRKTNPGASAANLKSVLQRRWEAMSEKHRAVYADEAAKSGSGNIAPSTSTPAAPPSTSTASTSRTYDGFGYYLNTQGLNIRRIFPQYSYDQVVDATKRQWDALHPAEKSNYSNKAFAAAQHPIDKGIFTRLEAHFYKANRGKATVSSTPAAPSYNASSSSSSRDDQADGFGFWLRFEERKFKQKNPGLTHEQAVVALKFQWDGMTQMARGIYEDMAAKENAKANMTAKPTASQTPSSSGSLAWEAWAQKYDGFNWFLNSKGCDLKQGNRALDYDVIVTTMKARWQSMITEERREFEDKAKMMRSSLGGRRMFSKLLRLCGLPEEPDVPPPRANDNAHQKPTSSSTTTTTASSIPSSNTSSSLTWEAWAQKYDGFNWFLNSRGYDYKQKSRDADFNYDQVVKIMELQWKHMSDWERREFEDKAKILRTNLGGRQMFSRLRRLCGLPEEPDVPQPAKTVKPRTPFPSTWRGRGSKAATSLMSSSPVRPDPPSASSADRTLTEIQPNRMAATPGLSDKVAKIDITSAWAVKTGKLKIPQLSTPRSGSGSASASASASGSASASTSRGVKRKAKADVIDLTLDD